MLKIEKRLNNRLNYTTHAKTWMKSFFIGILNYTLWIGFHAGDLDWGIALMILGGFVSLQFTLIPALVIAFLLTKESITNWIEDHKILFIIITTSSIAGFLLITKVIGSIRYANGYFAMNWDNFFEHFGLGMWLLLCPFLVYTFLITYKISFNQQDTNR
jgi:hypothetical protein